MRSIVLTSRAARLRGARRVATFASAALASFASSCAEPGPYCGGFEPSVTYDLELQRLSLDVSESRPVQGLLCPKLPLECECIETGADGRARSELPADSEILVEVQAPGYLTTIATTTTTTEDRLATLRVIDRTTVSVLAGVVGERIDTSLGHAGIRLAPAEGADVTGTVVVLRHVDSGEPQRVIYTVNALPSAEATATDDTGVVLATNIPPGRYRLESDALASCGVVDAGWPRYDESGRLVALEFEVRANAVTLIDVLRCHGAP